MTTTDGYYTIVGSTGIRSNSIYNVAVTSHGYANEIEVVVGIKSKDQTESFNVQENVRVDKWSTKTIGLIIGSIPHESYELYAKSIKNIPDFDQRTDLEYVSKQYSVYIQTDKADYLPGDLIRFRVVVLGPDLKAFYPKDPIQIKINDASANLIKQFTDVILSKGVFKGELQLTKYPPIGDWTITFESGGINESKMISVERYVLPKFEVTVTPVRHVTFSDGKISATIAAKYTYGENVKGTLTVEAYSSNSGMGLFGSNNSVPLVSQTFNDFNGQKLVEFTFNDLFGCSNLNEKDFTIKAFLKEGLTGNSRSGESTVSVHQYPYEIKITGKPKFSPNLPYTATAKVSYWDGSPVRNTSNPVQVTIQSQQNFGCRRPMMHPGTTPESPHKTQMNLTLDNNGMSTISFIPTTDYNEYHIFARYKEVLDQNLYIKKIESDANEFIKLSIATPNPTANNPVEIEVQGTAEFERITYLVVARGNVVLSDTVSGGNSKAATIKFTTTNLMTSNSIVFAYYITESGKFVYDSVELSMASSFPNTIQVGVSKSKLKPGDDFDISVKTTPHSYCGLLGVDQSVLLQKSGNDFDRNVIMAGLQGFDSPKQHDHSYPEFDDITTVVITNVEPKPPKPVFRYRKIIRRNMDGMENQMMAFGAAPMAFGGAPQQGQLFGQPIAALPPRCYKAAPPLPPPVVRKGFPPIFLWEDIEDVVNDKNEDIIRLRRKAPDTITKWVITGFTIDDTTGFGLSDEPTMLTTFLPFFIRLELPYSVIRGETVTMKITVFNYQSTDSTAIVTFANNNGDFTWKEGNDETHHNHDKLRSKEVHIPANDSAQISFLISPHTIGPIPIKVTAVSDQAGDSIEQPLLVEAEGSTKYTTRGYLIDLRTNPSFSVDVESGFPAKYVPDSQLITVSCIGDILGSAIKNLDNLIQMPYGCGEQNLLSMFPNIVVVVYLTTVGQLTAEIKTKAISYMEAGYQRQLSYIHPEGSFSAFGPSGGAKGSTWLTAFAMKAFIESTPFISVDQKVIEKGMLVLMNCQSSDGSFIEHGNVIHKDMQGGGANGIGLTAYVLSILLLSPVYATKYSVQINKTINYIMTIINKDSSIDIYPLAVAAYALQLANHPQKDTVLDQLITRATKTSDDLVYWEKIMPKDNSFWYRAIPNSVSVEITSYAVLALIKSGRVVEALPSLRWLISKQNPTGGFSSTQDTVMGIEAMSQMAAAIFAGNPTLDVKILADAQTTNFNINKENAYVLQQVEVDSDTTKLQIQATGNGIGMCTVSYKYNVKEASVFPRFKLNAVVDEKSTSSLLYLKITMNYVIDASADDLQSNMALLSITLPSGFAADTEYLATLVGTKNIARWETRNQDSIIDLYLDSVNESEIVLSVQANEICKVANRKPVSVRIVDFYDNAKSAEVFYEP